VYQELTQLIRAGFAVRFLYSHLDHQAPLPAQFHPLWRGRRRLTLHHEVCEQSYAYFQARMPARVESLIDMLARASGLTPEAVRAHYHVRQSFAFARMVEAYRPGYLHSYFFYEGTLFALAASVLLDIPRGVSSYADHVLDDYSLKVVGLHLRQSSIVIATSARIKSELLRIEPQTPEDRVLVKPNGINTDRFPASARPEPREGQPFSLVSVCRIEPKKGLVHLVEAIALLRERNVNVVLHHIGGVDNSDASRDYHHRLTETIARLGLEGSVHLDGVKSESEINAIFGASHVFVAPFVETDGGDKDGIPTALLEGMAAGLPTVATNAGSILEVIEDGVDGVIVPQGDAEALASAIATLLRDPERRVEIGDRGSLKIRDQFNVATTERVFHDRVRALPDVRIEPA
jgi:glycosyltransferase involved in cell wall biosynthesis